MCLGTMRRAYILLHYIKNAHIYIFRCEHFNIILIYLQRDIRAVDQQLQVLFQLRCLCISQNSFGNEQQDL